MELRLANDKKSLYEIRPLYERAFPQSEKKPFSLIAHKAYKGQLEVLKIHDDDGTYVGFFIVVLGKDALLLDYFAITELARGKGIGTKALLLLSAHYSSKRVIIEIEDPGVPSDNAEAREKRLTFYSRNGFVINDKITLFGVDMLLLSLNGKVDFDEYKAVFVGVFGKLLGHGLKRRI